MVFIADELWANIAEANNRFSGLLEDVRVLAEQDTTAYRTQLIQYSRLNHSEVSSFDILTRPRFNSAYLQLTAGEWNTHEVLQLLANIRYTVEEIRNGMRLMGDLAGVPIEPKEQTALLDGCIAIPGVICGGVPGGKSIAVVKINYKLITRST